MSIIHNTKMADQTLPLIPFGKYRGQPITMLLNDTKYLEWCKQQEWFQKFPIVYNICVNQTITTSNHNSKTPEHNKLQNLFLENTNVEKILRLIHKTFKYKNNISYSVANVEFEGQFNWDVIIDDLTFTKLQCNCNWDAKDENECCNCKYENDDDYEYGLSNVYIEIKPLLGDDYPCVLRKIKLQKELTLNSLKKDRQDSLDEVGYIKGKNHILEYGFDKFKEVKETMDYVDKNFRTYFGSFVLLIKEYSSNTTPKDKLIEIFAQSDIKIIFTNDIVNELSNQTITEHISDVIVLPIQQNIEEENNLLREKILQLETKNKYLEEQLVLINTKNNLSSKNISVKISKQSRTIVDCFKKHNH